MPIKNHKHQTMAFELTDLSKVLAKHQEQFRCTICRQLYQTKWYYIQHEKCYFCRRFNPENYSYHSLLWEIEWCFIQSGELNRNEYYNNYLDYLYNWCSYFRIPAQEADMQREYELRFVE